MTGSLKKSAQAGFSLMETLLVVGLLSGIMLVLTMLLQDYMRKEHMRAVADQLGVVQKAVNTMIGSVEQFNALYDLAQASGGVAEISILAPGNPNRTLGYNPTGNASLEKGAASLAASNIVNAGPGVDSAFSDTLPIRASSYVEGESGPQANERQEVRLTVLARAVNSGEGKALEIMVASIDRLSERDLRDVTAHMKADGGYISAIDGATAALCHASGCAATARSAYGNWVAHMPVFNGTRWYSIMNARKATPETGGYLVSYAYINEKVLEGDYLYRRHVKGSPQLNRMNASLNLGGNNIVGADNVEIKNSSGTALHVKKALYAQGSVFVGGNLNVKGDLISDNDITANTVTVDLIDPSMTLRPPFGRVTVKNDFETANMTVNNNVSVRGDMSANDLLGAKQLSIKGNLAARTIDAAQGGVMTKTMSVTDGSLKASGHLVAARIVAKDVEAKKGGVIQGEMGGGLQVAKKLTLQANSKLSTVGNLTIDNIVECKSGC